MKCSVCGEVDTKVLDTRLAKEGSVVRRRRQCPQCLVRYTTYEKTEEPQIFLVKKDGRRELFDDQKLIKSIQIACHKRNISIEIMEKIGLEIKKDLFESQYGEIKSKKVGGLVMDALRELDEVAYVRFASVYKRFQDPAEFVTELQNLQG